MTRQPYYPETDGQPMAETDVHRRYIIDLHAALEDHFASDPDVYVSGNLMMYYVEGEPSQWVAPDVMVVRGIPKRQRATYKLWEEGKAPDFVLEVTSPSTRINDLGAKKGLYELLDVSEYFLFDPLGEYLKPPLQGFRLVQGRYRPIAGRDGRFTSSVLGLELRLRDGQLRLHDAGAARSLLTPAESEAALRAAQDELTQLRAELERTRKRDP